MKYDGIIFDLDGTLWDSSTASAEAFNQAYQEHHIDKRVDADFIRSISGRTSSECDQILLEHVPEKDKKAVLNLFDKLEIQFLKQSAEQSLYPGVLDGLSSLQKDYPLYLVSNCNEEYLDVFFNYTSAGNKFTDYESHGRTGLPKYSNIKAVIERNNLESACYVGDTEWDQQAALKAGVDYYHLNWGFGKVSKAQGFFDGFEGLITCLRN